VDTDKPPSKLIKIDDFGILACSIADLESEPGLFLSNKEVINSSFYFFIFYLMKFFGEVILILRDVCCFLCQKRVFLEADMMAKKYKENLPLAFMTKGSKPLSKSILPVENEALYANWKWFMFEK
jgi:small subunit ribosomal protein S1